MNDAPNVLLADDDPRNLLALASLLDGLGARIVTVSSGLEALRALLENEFAVIVLDVRMPELDGFETATLVRQRQRSARTPIIFVTGNDPTSDAMFRGYEVGAVDYIVKPVHPAVLRSKVAVFLDLYRKTREVERQAQLLRQAEQREHERRMEALALAERRRAAEEVRAVADRMELVLRTVPIVVCGGLFDPDARITSVTPNVERITGFAAERFVAEPTFWTDRIHPEDRPSVLARLEEMRVTGQMIAEYRWECADGAWRWFLHQAALLPPEGGKPGITGTWLDVTERRRHEETLFQASKLESIGVLAGGIAHDFNNLLTGITASVSLAIAHEQRGRPVGDRLRTAMAACERAKRLTHQLLTFSRGGKPVRQPVALEALVNESASFAMQGSRSRLELLVEDDLWAIEADAGQVAQAVQNLVINADQAMPDGGVVRVQLANKTLEPQRRLDAPGAVPGRYVVVTVTDTGAGIPPDVLGRIFDPFFTTKPTGTGLGLATVYSIARRHGGAVTASSTPGAGARFDLYLPAGLADVSQPAPPPEPRATTLRGGTGRVLVMDDEPQVRQLLGEALLTLGYEPRLVADGADAIAMWRDARRRGEPFDVLVMDLTVPGGMGGAEAVRQIRLEDPEVRAIVSSGYSNDPIVANPGASGFAGVLRKPWELVDLDAVLVNVRPGTSKPGQGAGATAG